MDRDHNTQRMRDLKRVRSDAGLSSSEQVEVPTRAQHQAQEVDWNQKLENRHAPHQAPPQPQHLRSNSAPQAFKTHHPVHFGSSSQHDNVFGGFDAIPVYAQSPHLPSWTPMHDSQHHGSTITRWPPPVSRIESTATASQENRPVFLRISQEQTGSTSHQARPLTPDRSPDQEIASLRAHISALSNSSANPISAQVGAEIIIPRVTSTHGHALAASTPSRPDNGNAATAATTGSKRTRMNDETDAVNKRARATPSEGPPKPRGRPLGCKTGDGRGKNSRHARNIKTEAQQYTELPLSYHEIELMEREKIRCLVPSICPWTSARPNGLPESTWMKMLGDEKCPWQGRYHTVSHEPRDAMVRSGPEYKEAVEQTLSLPLMYWEAGLSRSDGLSTRPFDPPSFKAGARAK